MTSTSAAPSSPTPLSAAESFSDVTIGYCPHRVPTTKEEKEKMPWRRSKICMHEVSVSADGIWQCPNHAKHIT